MSPWETAEEVRGQIYSSTQDTRQDGTQGQDSAGTESRAETPSATGTTTTVESVVRAQGASGPKSTETDGYAEARVDCETRLRNTCNATGGWVKDGSIVDDQAFCSAHQNNNPITCGMPCHGTCAHRVRANQ